MYFLMAMFITVVGICFFLSVNRMAKNRAAVRGIKIVKLVGVVLTVIGISMLYLLFSGKVVLPLSKG